jgi:hypothetical protein
VITTDSTTEAPQASAPNSAHYPALKLGSDGCYLEEGPGECFYCTGPETD